MIRHFNHINLTILNGNKDHYHRPPPVSSLGTATTTARAVAEFTSKSFEVEYVEGSIIMP